MNRINPSLFLLIAGHCEPETINNLKKIPQIERLFINGSSFFTYLNRPNRFLSDLENREVRRRNISYAITKEAVKFGYNFPKLLTLWRSLTEHYHPLFGQNPRCWSYNREKGLFSAVLNPQELICFIREKILLLTENPQPDSLDIKNKELLFSFSWLAKIGLSSNHSFYEKISHFIETLFSRNFSIFSLDMPETAVDITAQCLSCFDTDPSLYIELLEYFPPETNKIKMFSGILNNLIKADKIETALSLLNWALNAFPASTESLQSLILRIKEEFNRN